MIFVGLGGNTGRLDEVVQLCRDRGLTLILDAAHMSGTRLRGQHVGRESEVSVFSFHAVKNLPTADGGMICFRSAEDDAAVRHWTWLGHRQGHVFRGRTATAPTSGTTRSSTSASSTTATR